MDSEIFFVMKTGTNRSEIIIGYSTLDYVITLEHTRKGKTRVIFLFDLYRTSLTLSAYTVLVFCQTRIPYSRLFIKNVCSFLQIKFVKMMLLLENSAWKGPFFVQIK